MVTGRAPASDEESTISRKQDMEEGMELASKVTRKSMRLASRVDKPEFIGSKRRIRCKKHHGWKFAGKFEFGRRRADGLCGPILSRDVQGKKKEADTHSSRHTYGTDLGDENIPQSRHRS